MTTHINGAYLDGISDGRSLLKANPNWGFIEIQTCYKNSRENVKRHSFAMKDYFKGEQDFWKNQLKILEQKS